VRKADDGIVGRRLIGEEDRFYDFAGPALRIASSLHDSLMVRLDQELAPVREVAQIGATMSTGGGCRPAGRASARRARPHNGLRQTCRISLLPVDAGGLARSLTAPRWSFRIAAQSWRGPERIRTPKKRDVHFF
jgi:hypothetical protein